jgi:predicted PurR-regulated permease PerM
MVIVGAPYALLLGIISGLTEVIPIIGPIAGAVPGLLLAAVSGDWFLVLKVLAVYVVVQQLENNLLVPKIQGASVKMHPAIVMVALVVGSQVAGLLGMIVAVPVGAALRDVYLYLYRRFAEEPAPVSGQVDTHPHQVGGSTSDKESEEHAQENLAEATRT